MEYHGPHDETVRERVRELWAQVPKLSASQIGQRMNLTKNMIIGLSRRMKLPSRESPIPQKAGEKRPSPERVAVIPVAPIRAVKPVFATPPPKPPTPLPYRRMSQCSYVTNTGRFGVGITYCDDPAVPGKPYCIDHARRCFVPVRPRGEIADAAD